MTNDYKGEWLMRDGTKVKVVAQLVAQFGTEYWKGYIENQATFLLWDSKGNYVLEGEEFRKFDLMKRLPDKADYVIGEA